MLEPFLPLSICLLLLLCSCVCGFLLLFIVWLESYVGL